MIDLNDVQTKELDFTVGGESVSARRLGMAASMWLSDSLSADNTVSAEEIAKTVANGLVYTETGERVYSDADIPALLEKDLGAMSAIFQEIIGLSFSAFEEAEKN